MRLILVVAILVVGSMSLWAQITVSTTPEGRVVYQRATDDPVFNRFGIGRPPHGVDAYLWYVYDPYILQLCREEGVDPVMAKAVLFCESRFSWRATSRAGAKGLMQLMDGTAERMGVRPGHEPLNNLRGGIRYLAYLQTLFAGNLVHIAAGFNAGEQAVRRYGGIPPFKETQTYVPKVLWTWDWIQTPNWRNP